MLTKFTFGVALIHAVMIEISRHTQLIHPKEYFLKRRIQNFINIS